MTEPLDPAKVMAAHQSRGVQTGWPLTPCLRCGAVWPCLPYRLAADLAEAEAWKREAFQQDEDFRRVRAERDRLAAALAEAKRKLAEAWDEGEASGSSRAMRRMSDEPNIQRASNPYRAALGGAE